MSKDQLEMLREKAQESLSRGKYQEARQFYQQALGYRSDHPDIHYGIATVCFVLSDLHSAVYHFKEVTRLDPLRAGAYINLGAVYKRLGQYDDALAALRRGIQLDTHRAEGFYNLGLVYKHLGQLDLAINAYREAVRVNPRMCEAHYNLGNIFLEKNQLVLAVAHYHQALEIRPNWDKARAALETVEAEQANLQKDQTPPPQEAPPVKDNPKLDPLRLIDPQVHGKWLRDLHHLVIEVDSSSQSVLEFLQHDVELAIRELSICILTPDDTHHKLEDRIQQFDAVVTQMRNLRDTLQKRIDRSRAMSEQIAKH